MGEGVLYDVTSNQFTFASLSCLFSPKSKELIF